VSPPHEIERHFTTKEKKMISISKLGEGIETTWEGEAKEAVDNFSTSQGPVPFSFSNKCAGK
jgi:hypothetical protein